MGELSRKVAKVLEAFAIVMTMGLAGLFAGQLLRLIEQ